MQKQKGKRKTCYLSNTNLLAELKKSHEQNKMTDQLALMLKAMCLRYASKGNYSQYSYNDEMQGHALVSLMKSWKSFDITKGSNPFSYFTQCIKNSFSQVLNNEKKQRNIRDKLLITNGFDPSFSFQLENENNKDTSESFFDDYDAEPVKSDSNQSFKEEEQI